MGYYPKSLQRLIDELAKLPGVGEKTAQRLAFHLVARDNTDVQDLAQALTGVKENIHLCPECFTVTDQDLCAVCADPGRDRTVICVVENTRDLYALERTNDYKGLYHVLGGVISPLEGIGPKDIRARELLERLKEEPVKEVIMATNPSPEGEATAMYLKNLIAPAGIRVTRLAKGVPIGADMEYIDEITLSKALEGRQEF